VSSVSLRRKLPLGFKLETISAEEILKSDAEAPWRLSSEFQDLCQSEILKVLDRASRSSDWELLPRIREVRVQIGAGILAVSSVRARVKDRQVLRSAA
jgi:hypothetical protein